jgi:hypothetical protein
MDSLSGMPMVGVSSLFHLNASAVLTIPILGSVRNIRDFTEGPFAVCIPSSKMASKSRRLRMQGWFCRGFGLTT